VLNNVTVAERELTFGRDGAELVPNAVDERTLRAILDATSDLSPERAGTRLYGIDTLAPILSAEGRRARSRPESSATIAVRCARVTFRRGRNQASPV
jgi:hypothetical protein